MSVRHLSHLPRLKACTRQTEQIAILSFSAVCASRIQHPTGINVPCQRREYAKPSATKKILNIFKQKNIWEEPKSDDKLEAYHLTARKLKELTFGAKPSAKVLADLIVQFVRELPDQRIPVKYIPVLDSSVNTVIELSSGDPLKNFTIEDLNRVFKVASSSIIEAKGARKASQPISTRLYSILYRNRQKLTPLEGLENGILYGKYLRSQGMITESTKLFGALISQYKADIEPDSDFLVDAIICIRDYNPDIASIITLFKTFRSLHILPDIRIYHEAVLACNTIAGGDPRQFTKDFEHFINDIILVDMARFNQISEETVILVLDGCLSINSVNCGQRALRSLASNSIDELRIENRESRLQYYELLLMACTKFGEDLSFGTRIVDKILTAFDLSEFAKETWDVLAQWTVYRSSNVDDTLGLLRQMEDAGYGPDDATMNAILSIAVSTAKRNDRYVEQIVSHFSEDLSVKCNVETFSYLIDRSLNALDNDRALGYFQQSMDNGCQWNFNNHHYFGSLDRLITALATSPPVDAKATFAVYQRIRAFSNSVAYETQAAILKMMVDNGFAAEVGRFLCDEFAKGNEALRPRIPHQHIPLIYQTLYDYLMTSNDHYTVLWHVYGAMNKYISLPHESYFPILDRFCRLGRPDAALLIFKYLRVRNQREGLAPPGSDIYVLLFNWFGRHKYDVGVNELYTFYKMDLGIEPNINILNSVLRAFHQLESPLDVGVTWDLIKTTSSPNNETISIMIQELATVSMTEVEKFWIGVSKQFNLRPSKENLRQYLIANCKHGYFMRALEITKNMETVYGIEPDESILETLYNWTSLDSRKDNVEKWALAAHPEKWKALKEADRLKPFLIGAQNEETLGAEGEIIEQSTNKQN